MKDNNFLQGLALVSQLGISMATPIFLGIFIGNFIDKKLNTKGIFLLIFTIFGVGAAIAAIFQLTKNDRKQK